MYKRFVFWLLAGGVLLGATSCYKDVMDMEVDPIHPEFILPVVRDTLRVEQLLTREKEQTLFEYEADGTCVAVYREKRDILNNGLSAHITQKQGTETETFDVGATPSKTYNFPWEILPGHEVKEVTFKSAKVFKIHFSRQKETTDVAEGPFAEVMLEGKFTWGNPADPLVSKEFKVPAGGESDIDITTEILSGKAFPFHDGTYYNKCPFTVSDLTLVGATGTQKVKLEIGVDFLDLELKEAIGHQKVGGVIAKTKTSLQRKIDIFGTMLRAEANLPAATVSLQVIKNPKMAATLLVEKIQAVPNTIREDNPEAVEVVNQNVDNLTEAQKAKSLLIGKEQSLGDASSKTFVLDASNSNITDIFNGALFDLNVQNVTLSIEADNSMVDKPLELDSKIAYELELRIPFYGTLTTSKMVSDMRLSDNTFPKDVKQYLKSPDNKAEIDQAVTLYIGILNTLPMDGYAKIEFLDAGKSPIMALSVSNEGGKTKDGANLFIPCGDVNGEGRVNKPAFREHVHSISKDMYENLSNNAKFMRTTYYFVTPEGKKVRVKKDDNVLLQIAVDVKANGKPSDLVNMGKDLGKTI